MAGVSPLAQGAFSVSVDLSGVGACVGALRLEGRRGALLSNTLSVLMMPCAASAAEVCQLEGSKGRCLRDRPVACALGRVSGREGASHVARMRLSAGSCVDDIPAFLYELGLVLRQTPGAPALGAQGGAGARPGHPTMMAAAAARLAAFAVSMQWLHVTRLLLPLALLPGRPVALVVADMDASLPKGGALRCAAAFTG